MREPGSSFAEGRGKDRLSSDRDGEIGSDSRAPMADCVFCGIAAKTIPSRIVVEKDGLVAFHDTKPQAPTHVLIVPKRHIGTLNDLAATDADMVGRLILLGAEVAKDLGLDQSGYRLVFNTGAGAGQTVLHIHLHLLGGRALAWPPG